MNHSTNETNDLLLGRWEVFDEGPTVPPEQRMYVTINQKCVIHLNANIVDALGRPAHVLMMLDPERSLIGILPVKRETSKSFPLIIQGKGRHRRLAARPFCRRHGIRFGATRAFHNPYIDEHGVLQLDLTTTMPADRLSRFKKRFNGPIDNLK
jgi:hypothetical protein